MRAGVDRGALYGILREVARRRERIPYSSLAEEYNARAGTHYGARGVWDRPLGELNQRLDAAGRPPLAALVVSKSTDEPGPGFWGSTSRIPERPSDDARRRTLYERILEDVYAHPWPERLPEDPQAAGTPTSTGLENLLAPDAPPLRLNRDGVLCVRGTRVPLDTVVASYQEGASPEEIVLAYDSLDLADVYQAVAFYLRHRPAVEAYLAERQQKAEGVRRENQARWPTDGLRERLLARRRKAS